jgi:glycosyltransferase involved in cell wall biosynthesis
MTIKILAIGDISNILRTLNKYLKKSEIHVINFPRENSGEFTSIGDVEEFETWKVMDQVEKINEIKNNFDLCITTGTGERIAYLCDLNYIPIYFGRDIDAPRFIKNSKEEWNDEPLHKLNILERIFYKNAFRNAVLHIAGLFVYKHLIKYSKNSLNNARISIDRDIFNQNTNELSRKKNKFTFFSPNRIEKFKGTDILWNSLKYCKTDFEILQVNWFGETQNEEKLFKKDMLKNIPKQVTLIPMIKYSEIPKYYKFADAIIGNMFIGNHELVALEGVLCKKPVISYTDPNTKLIIDGKEIKSPFLPRSKDPKEIAKIIDMLVESSEKRNELFEREYEFVMEITDPEKCAKWWDNLFEKMTKEYPTIKKNSSWSSILLRKILFLIGNRLYFKKLKQIFNH